MKSTVVLVRCESYDYSEVKEAISKGVSLLGGVGKFARTKEKILLKPNMLMGSLPEKAATTHPSVFKAVAEMFISTGANVKYGDSPGFGKPGVAAKKCGLSQVSTELNIDLADFEKGQDVLCEKAVQNKKFTIANAVMEADGIISLPKLKTHGLEKFTGCVKNQFGCVPGLLKGEFHVKMPNSLDFAKMLVDLNNYVKPRLYIMDGIYGMEGNGPMGGDPRKMNIILFSEDPIALDATVCRLINLDPELVPTIKYGFDSGAGEYAEENIELLGDPFAEFYMKDFNIDRTEIKPKEFKKGIVTFLNNLLISKPIIDEKKCVKCGVCVLMCPTNPKSVDWKDGDKTHAPKYDYNKCIRCYCCQEMCPESVISLKSPVIKKILRRK